MGYNIISRRLSFPILHALKSVVTVRYTLMGLSFAYCDLKLADIFLQVGMLN